MWGWRVSNGKMCAFRIGTGMGHTNEARLVVVELADFGANIVIDLIAFLRFYLSNLCHKIWNHAMEGSTIIEAIFDELKEISDGSWSYVGKQFDGDISFVGLYNSLRSEIKLT